MADYTVLIPLIFLILNFVAFIVYAVDKWKAQRDAWRIPESTLLTVAAIAPWGSLAGMYYFRHKTKKPKFKLVWVFAVIHAVVAALLLVLI
ncbi:MAG: DUF1294 domain-containing protein [Candidatus Methanomethylophilaceae archaeon]|nr:DUF1294 domain-containing protein [Candidatus Methanomethylophilaceae archaeon]